MGSVPGVHHVRVPLRVREPEPLVDRDGRRVVRLDVQDHLVQAPAGEVLFLAVTDRDGHQYDVASWTGTASGRTVLTAACWMKPGDIVQVQVHTREGTPIATATA